MISNLFLSFESTDILISGDCLQISNFAVRMVSLTAVDEFILISGDCLQISNFAVRMVSLTAVDELLMR